MTHLIAILIGVLVGVAIYRIYPAPTESVVARGKKLLDALKGRK